MILASLFLADGGRFDSTTELVLTLSIYVGSAKLTLDALGGCIDISGRIMTKFLESLTI